MAPPDQKQPTRIREDEPEKISSGELLAGRRQLIIQHGSVQYRLRLTASNKLILTK
jgi:hemin uptake protein HemP